MIMTTLTVNDRVHAVTVEATATVLDVLRDHHSYPLSLCRHLDSRDAELEQSETIWTVVMNLDECSIELISGPPCTQQKGFEIKPFD